MDEPLVVITTADCELTLPKSVLVERSCVFAAMFENEMQESLENIVRISDFSAETVRFAFDDLAQVQESLNEENVETIYRFAQKYQIFVILNIAKSHFTDKLNGDNVVDILLLADAHSDFALKDEVMKFLVCDRASHLLTQTSVLEALGPILISEVFSTLLTNNQPRHIDDPNNTIAPNFRGLNDYVLVVKGAGSPNANGTYHYYMQTTICENVIFRKNGTFENQFGVYSLIKGKISDGSVTWSICFDSFEQKFLYMAIVSNSKTKKQTSFVDLEWFLTSERAFNVATAGVNPPPTVKWVKRH